MPGFYTGNHLQAIIAHNLDQANSDGVSPPEGWTLTGATIEALNARFVNNLRADVAGERLFSDAATSFDGSDGKKVLFHCFWQTPTLAGVQTLGGIVNSARSVNRTRMHHFGGAIRLDWTRASNLAGAGTPFLRRSSTGGHLSVDTSHELVGFMDSGSVSQGKVFIDGVDRTGGIINDASFGALAGSQQHGLLGNHFNNLDPAQFVDEFTLIQDDAMNDAKVVDLVAKYTGVRGFGYRPRFTSLAAAA